VPPVGWAAFPAGKGITEQGLGVFRGLAGWRREAGTGGGGEKALLLGGLGCHLGFLNGLGILSVSGLDRKFLGRKFY
jgi:hypothetical protein